MTEGEATAERPPSDLVRIVLEAFDTSIEDVDLGVRGEDSVGWRGTSAEGDRFVQLFPTWRTVEELAWCNAVARAAATAAPACVSAVASHDGRVVVPTNDGPVMVFPFVDGRHPGDQPIGAAAAETLAELHRGIASAWDPGMGPRPSRNRWVAGRVDIMVDQELDRWEAVVAARPVGGLPIHGDFYGGNLLVVDGRIAGVVDWWDADLVPTEHEVAWAAWEFGQDDSGEDITAEEVESFLDGYRRAGGPAPVDPPFDPFPWIRRRLRIETRTWFADPRSESLEDAYYGAQLVAFERLRGRRLPGR